MGKGESEGIFDLQASNIFVVRIASDPVAASNHAGFNHAIIPLLHLLSRGDKFVALIYLLRRQPRALAVWRSCPNFIPLYVNFNTREPLVTWLQTTATLQVPL